MPGMPADFEFTLWRNDTDHDLVVRLFMGPGRDYRLTFKPKEERPLLSIYDNAIQTRRGGQIVGGIAPQLTKVGAEKLPIAEALARASALGDMERKIMLETGVTAGGKVDAMAVLLAKQAELEAQLKAQSKPEPSALEIENAALKAKTAEQEKTMAALLARLEKIEAQTAMPPAAPAQPEKKTAGPKGVPAGAGGAE